MNGASVECLLFCNCQRMSFHFFPPPLSITKKVVDKLEEKGYCTLSAKKGLKNACVLRFLGALFYILRFLTSSSKGILDNDECY